MAFSFIPKPTNGNEPVRCVDGRPDPNSTQGPQMLGGSLHPILLEAIFNYSDLDQAAVSKNIHALQKSGIITGAHRGTHKNGDASDCGFADRMPDIVSTAIDNQDLIASRLQQIFEANEDKFTDLNPQQFADLVNRAYEKIAAYSPSRIRIKGERLVAQVENSNSHTESVHGEHKEEVAFVNLRGDTTLDTKSLNNNGQQGFNLDLFPAVYHARAIGVPEDFSIPASLILYQATEIVLVENKGKPALPVEIHS